MIQFNLLPDVKLEYIRARRAQRLVFGVSAVIVSISVGVLIIVLMVGLAQGKHLSDLNKDILSESNELKKKPQIDRILTVQNQLESLGPLHDTKPAATRVFDYLNQVTPADVSITSFTIDFVAHTATINGNAKSLSGINTYVDTLKFTKYQVGKEKDTKPAFSDIVLTSFALADPTQPGDPGKGKATYALTLVYDPPIYDITQSIKLKVPDQVTTRSEIEKPTDLFVESSASSSTPSPTPKSTGGGQ